MNILPDFYDADALERLAINLFYGWGYNFYRVENQLRADDQLVRAKVGLLLGEARRTIETAEAEWRRTRLPPPSRAQPFPDAEAVAGAQRLERLSAAIGAAMGQVQAQPVPENDRIAQRRRTEAATLDRLIGCDRRLAAQAEMLRAAAAGQPGAWLIANAAAVEGALAAIEATLHDRAVVLAA